MERGREGEGGHGRRKRGGGGGEKDVGLNMENKLFYAPGHRHVILQIHFSHT